MFKTKKFLLPLLTLALAGASLAQSLDGTKFYKLDFVVREVEAGKPVNSRTFSTILQVQTPQRDVSPANIRAGGRVPFTTGGSTQYYELGVSIDAKDLRETQTDVSVFITSDISTIAQDAPGNTTPITRQNRWSSTVIVPVKKPTVVFASDDISSKRQLQLEVTAIPIAK
jgi:hypothetical protein